MKIKGEIYQAIIINNESLVYVLCTKNSDGDTFEGVCLHEGFHEKKKNPSSLNPVGDFYQEWSSDIFSKADVKFSDLLVEIGSKEPPIKSYKSAYGFEWYINPNNKGVMTFSMEDERKSFLITTNPIQEFADPFKFDNKEIVYMRANIHASDWGSKLSQTKFRFMGTIDEMCDIINAIYHGQKITKLLMNQGWRDGEVRGSSVFKD